MNGTRAPKPLFCALLLALAAGTVGALEEAPGTPRAGIPPIGIDVPSLVVRGVEASLTVDARALDAVGPTRVELRGTDGRLLAEGSLQAGTTNTVAWVPGPESTIVVALPDHYRETLTVDVRSIPGWMTLLPPVLAIGLALVFRQVLPALAAGVWIGSWIVYGNPISGALHAIDHFLVQTLTDGDHVSIILFSLTLGGMVGVISRSGGTNGLVQSLKPLATSARRGQVVTWLLGLFVFFDDYANSLLVGNTMRPVTDKLHVSREKLAYLVDSTAAPVASIALVSTWIGYEVSLIGESLIETGRDLDPYAVFLRSLPYNFYPILALAFGLMVAAGGRDFGAMLRAEERAAGGRVLGEGAVPLADFDQDAMAPPAGKPRRWFNAVVPIAVVLVVTFSGLWATGQASLRADDVTRGSASWLKWVGDVFSAGDSYRALLWASAAGSLTALLLAIAQRILSLAESVTAWVNGVRSMLMAILILTLAWSISDVCSALNTKGFMVTALSDTLDPRLLPALIFVLAALTAFSTGTSWATMGILIPLAVPISFSLAEQSGMGEEGALRVLLASVSSVLAGAIFGDHCSPISDTTVLSSMASGCDHVDHVRTQLPYAVVVAIAAALFGYLPAGYGLSPWLGMLLAMAALGGLLYFVGRPRLPVEK